MFKSASPLYRLTLYNWEQIAFYTVTSEDTLLGPPSDLYALSLVCRHIYNAISVQNNSRLYARIFRFKFDTAAAERRLTERWLTTTCLASELISRFTVLKRIRKRDEFNRDDLWTCYLMMSESDGKNESQLIEWADIKQYLLKMTISRVPSSPVCWYEDPLSDSLMVWLLWMTASRDDIRTEHPTIRNLMIRILHPFIVAGYQHPSSYASDSCFNLPTCTEVDISFQPLRPWPSVAEIVHYSHKLTLAAPIVTSSAFLATTIRIEAFQDASTVPIYAMELPNDRETANALGIGGVTREDIMEFHFRDRIHLADRCPCTVDIGLDQESVEEDDNEESCSPVQGSKRYDEDWTRLVSCYDPQLSGDVPLRGVVYKLGSLSGSWAGRWMQPSFSDHLSLLANPHVTPVSVPLYHQPLYWKLQEHHCLGPEQPIFAGIDENGGDDVLNAWLPRGTAVRHLEDAIEVQDPNTERIIRYQTFVPRGTAPYSKSACEKLERPWISVDTDEEIAGDDTDSELGSALSDSMVPSISYIDNDDEYTDVVCHRSSGVSDILITGETGERHGDAWGHFVIIGRVRPWDGFVVLLRTPRNADESHLGRWVFKGYIHDKNFVGRWRETSTPGDMIGFEGGFAVARIDDS